MKLGLFIHNFESNNGPGKLSRNTIHGLQERNIDFCVDDYADINLCFSESKLLSHFLGKDIPNTIIGPCCMSLPTDMPEIINQYKNILLASKWMVDFWKTFDIISPDYYIDSWFGGIDHEYYHPDKNITNDFVIFYKDVTTAEFSSDNQGIFEYIKYMLEKNNLKYKTLQYHNYSQEDFFRIVNSSKYGIVLHKTETQGFAIMEAMSMNLPLFVLDETTWTNEYWSGNTTKYDKATSVPYFTRVCGMKINCSDVKNGNIDLESKIKEFIEYSHIFQPRLFITSYYTIDKSIDRLISYISNGNFIHECFNNTRKWSPR